MTIARIARHVLLPLCAGVLLAAAALGAPAQVRTQAPGYFRYAVGAFELTALNDGSDYLDPKLFHDAKPDVMARLLAASFEDGPKGIPVSFSAFLVNTGKHLVLVDTGLGECAAPATGRVVDNLRASGYRPEDVDAVLITHMHADHTCGLTSGGKRVFSNATVYAAEKEAGYWLNKNPQPAFSKGQQRNADRAQQVFAPYIAANAFRTFKDGAVLFPGVSAIATHGHTPGHTSYLFQSGSHDLLVWGDIVHAAALQFARPDISVDFDSDRKQAVATREALFVRLAQTKWAVAGAHLPFPGIGHVRKDRDGFAYVPAEYAPLPNKP